VGASHVCISTALVLAENAQAQRVLGYHVWEAYIMRGFEKIRSIVGHVRCRQRPRHGRVVSISCHHLDELFDERERSVLGFLVVSPVMVFASSMLCRVSCMRTAKQRCACTHELPVRLLIELI
jgi:hypothetical protein